MSSDVMRLALEALKKLWLLGDHAGAIANPAIKSLEEALAKQKHGEPVALPLHETEEMHDAVMGVLYEGVARTNT